MLEYVCVHVVRAVCDLSVATIATKKPSNTDDFLLLLLSLEIHRHYYDMPCDYDSIESET